VMKFLGFVLLLLGATIAQDADGGAPAAAGDTATGGAGGDVAGGGAATAPTTPLEIEATVIWKSVFSVSETDQTVGIQIMLKQQWTDPRVDGPPGGRAVDPKTIFNPDVQFLNSVKTEIRKEKVMIYPGNQVIKVKRCYLTLKQDMNYAWFPFDDHVWKIVFNSFTYNNNKLRYSSLKTEVDPKFSNGIFNFPNRTSAISESKYAPPIFNGQEFSTVEVLLPAHRNPGFFTSATIVPAVCLVLLSMLSFWIDGKVAPARVTLGTITVVGSLVLHSKVEAMLPKIAYATWLDAVIQGTFGFICSSLFLYVLVHNRINTGKSKDSANDTVDWWARRLFPGTFVLFIALMFLVGELAPPGAMEQLKEEIKHAHPDF